MVQTRSTVRLWWLGPLDHILLNLPTDSPTVTHTRSGMITATEATSRWIDFCHHCPHQLELSDFPIGFCLDFPDELLPVALISIWLTSFPLRSGVYASLGPEWVQHDDTMWLTGLAHGWWRSIDCFHHTVRKPKRQRHSSWQSQLHPVFMIPYQTCG